MEAMTFKNGGCGPSSVLAIREALLEQERLAAEDEVIEGLQAEEEKNNKKEALTQAGLRAEV